MHGTAQRLLRTLRTLAVRQPVWSCVIVTVLALGIGANALMFVVIDHLVLRPLPIDGLDRRVVLWESLPDRGVEKSSVSPANFLAWQESSHSFENMAAVRRTQLALRTEGGFEQVRGALVTEEFFDVFPTGTELGRLIAVEDLAAMGNDIAVISQRLWQRRFGADAEVLGSSIELDGRLCTIVGVLPVAADFPRETDVWLPVQLESEFENLDRRSLLVFASLRPGSNIASSRDEMAQIAVQLRRAQPISNAGSEIVVTSLRDELVRDYRSTVTLLGAAFAVILLIVCVNVANLLLVRNTVREQELVVSIALGASRWQVVRQLVEEVAILGLAAGGLGLGLAWVGRNVLFELVHLQLPRAAGLTLDLRSGLFTMLIAFATTVAVGLLPAGQFFRGSLNAFSSETLRARHRSRRAARLQRLMVICQVACALPLLVVATLLMRNLIDLRQVDLGFQPKGVMTLSMTVPQQAKLSAGQRVQSLQAVLARVGSLSQIRAAGAISELPMSGSSVNGTFIVEGRESAEVSDQPAADQRVVAPGYFTTMSIPKVVGRTFTEHDSAFAQPVAIINESLARRYWPNENALGQRIRIGAPEEIEIFGGSVAREIVGVVGNVRHHGLGSTWQPEIFLPHAQNPSRRMTIVAQVANEGMPAIADLRMAFEASPGNYYLASTLSMTEIVSRSLGYPEMQAWLVGFLGLISLILVSMSVYVVISHFLEQNLNSLAVRIASVRAREPSSHWCCGKEPCCALLA